ncbi:MAG: 1,4-alpha-glucan branching protein GlgB [Sulfurisoma sp.]|nr:1,4-alpha-glucan branching protein GlgB [Sulfurisoma sp.]
MMIDASLRPLIEAREHDPFRILGWHRDGKGWRLRVFRPHATGVAAKIDGEWRALRRVASTDFFEWSGAVAEASPARLKIDEGGQKFECLDPYGFPPRPLEQAQHYFAEGTNYQSYRLLGALTETRDGTAGVTFRVWAPNAGRVSLVGEFNRWDGRTHPLCSLGASGAWELFMPGLPEGTLYKFEIRNRNSGAVQTKTDPYGRQYERRPATAARVTADSAYAWNDAEWLARRARWDWQHAPMSIYEMHPGSWMRHPDGGFYGYREMAERLVPYLKDLAYTHIELMPVMEHPLDESWGYQCTGYFAPSSRFGSPDDLRYLIDQCHQAGIGVLLDWVPGHFPMDDWALAHFDGTALFEHEDPRLGVHQDWGTYIFNYGRNEVKSFLLSSADYWLREFHADGLRVDAVASMLYLDYSRRAGEWLPNKHGGRENLEAIAFLREMNEMVHREFPGALTIAEESTAWPMVSRPVYLGGLGFSMKWNMGWMNDTLDYMSQDPVHRRYHHERLTFGQLYAYSENFVLPFSHDEVVHGKGSLLGKMPGDEWQRFANQRLLLTYQTAASGKKLTFMGVELGQPWEWSEKGELPWNLPAFEPHAGMQRLVGDLNRLYAATPALYDLDFEHSGFSWIDCHDVEQSVVSWLRYARDGSFVVVVLNFTPVPRRGYRLGVPQGGAYRELFNSDSRHYGGGDVGNDGQLIARPHSWMGRPASIELTLPPLGGIVLTPVKG